MTIRSLVSESDDNREESNGEISDEDEEDEEKVTKTRQQQPQQQPPKQEQASTIPQGPESTVFPAGTNTSTASFFIACRLASRMKVVFTAYDTAEDLNTAVALAMAKKIPATDKTKDETIRNIISLMTGDPLVLHPLEVLKSYASVLCSRGGLVVGKDATQFLGFLGIRCIVLYEAGTLLGFAYGRSFALNMGINNADGSDANRYVDGFVVHGNSETSRFCDLWESAASSGTNTNKVYSEQDRQKHILCTLLALVKFAAVVCPDLISYVDSFTYFCKTPTPSVVFDVICFCFSFVFLDRVLIFILSQSRPRLLLSINPLTVPFVT